MMNFENSKPHQPTYFVEVILPLAIPKSYTYRVPLHFNDQIVIGKRAVVQFGKSKLYTSIIYKISQLAPQDYEAKYLLDVIDHFPIIHKLQLDLWEWIADYYMCCLGEVMAAALPSSLKLASETKIILNQDHQVNKSELSDKEFLILDALELQNELSITDIVKILGQKTVFPLLRSLLEKKVIFTSEEITEKFKPKKISILSLNDFYKDNDNLKALFGQLEKAPKQVDALLGFLKLSKEKESITSSDVMELSGVGPAIIKTLVEKDILLKEEKHISRFSTREIEEITSFNLSDDQESAFKSIKFSFEKQNVALLHGVTSSGKTQIYIKLIEEYLRGEDQILYLLPEIALTGQMIERLKIYFGNQIMVYHSRFNDNERAEIWQKVLKREIRIILGARSAIFLPFTKLALIIVDEEHDPSFKQYDPAPRYNARDVAIVLAQYSQAKILLGSATPSLESYFNAVSKKYGLVKLNNRYGGVKMPNINVVSISEEKSKKLIKDNFTSTLLEGIQQRLVRNEQVILFQNRRGYVPVVICKTCGNTAKCLNCDVSLTYHKTTGKLHCHYCGYKEDNQKECKACGSTKLEYKGLGTEKVEDDLKILLPETNIARLDYDTTRNKNAHNVILNDFGDKKIDILIGTQMVAKGLDFENVTLIGILNADSIIQFPDYRAYERSFQMLSQVAGRAGRRSKQGQVIIQTYDPRHRVIQQVVANDYEAMYREELIERKQFKYPPFYKIIQIDLKHKDLNKLLHLADAIGKALKLQLNDMILGPHSPLVSRIRNYYIQTLLVKINVKEQSIIKVKKVIKTIVKDFEKDKESRNFVIQLDVDPY